jgi:hypothetical protein
MPTTFDEARLPRLPGDAIRQPMRILLALGLLLLAACARVPTETATPAPPAAPPVPQQPRESGVLIGLTGPELAARFGRPILQIKEGNSFKLQFRSGQCVLDAFLYPSTGGQYRVTHVETRTLAGVDTNQGPCISTLQRAG